MKTIKEVYTLKNFVLGTIMCSVIAGFFISTKNIEIPVSKKALYLCQHQAEKSIISPESADFKSYKESYVEGIDGGFIVISSVKSDNIFGVKAENEFTCIVRESGDRLYISGIEFAK